MARRPRQLGTPQSPSDYFGAELRAYREAEGLSRPQLGERLGYSGQWIGQIELRNYPPSEEFARDCDTYFKTNGTFYRLWKWIQEAGQLQLLPPGFPDFLERESQAITMHIFENMAVTGLFQARGYAREVLSSGRTAEEVEQLVATRMERQEILREENPPYIVAVFDEGAVRRPIGDRPTRREQIEYLIELAQLPHITIQIVPVGKGAYAGLLGSFTMMSFADGPDTVYVEGHVGGQLIERPDTVQKHAVRFDLIRGAAMSADDSLALLRSFLEGL